MKKKMAIGLVLASILFIISTPLTALSGSSAQTQSMFQTMTHGLGG